LAGRCAPARPTNSPKAQLRHIHTRPILGGADGPNDEWIVGTYELEVSPTDEANSPTDVWAVGYDTVPGTTQVQTLTLTGTAPRGARSPARRGDRPGRR